MKRKTPQEKKALSYAKDCRNVYGANDKASRKNIPLRKAKVNRGYRKKVNEVLQKIGGEVDLETADLIESKAKEVKRDDWRKIPDAPLKEVVEQHFEWRERRAGHGKTALKRAREFVKNLKIKVEQETDERWIAEVIGMNGVLVYGETDKLAVEKCKRLAELVFLEQIGAVGRITVNGNSISYVSY